MKKIIEQIMKKDGLEKLLYLKQLVTTEWKKKFSNYQLKQITKGIESLLDVSIYARPEFNWRQMKEMRLQLLKKSTTK